MDIYRGLDYWEIYTISFINEKLVVNQVHQREEEEKSEKQNCF